LETCGSLKCWSLKLLPIVFDIAGSQKNIERT
jgi:hypothetical protein